MKDTKQRPSLNEILEMDIMKTRMKELGYIIEEEEEKSSGEPLPAKTDLSPTPPSKPVMKSAKLIRPPSNALKKRIDELAVPKKQTDRKSSGSKSRDSQKPPIIQMKMEEIQIKAKKDEEAKFDKAKKDEEAKNVV